MAYNILIVDDSATTRAVIIKTLGLAGVETNEVYQAANGREGLEVIEGKWVDLVFSDINMPEMSGVEMVERMSEDGLMQTVPVVIVSTEGSQTRLEELKARGVRACVRKPFTPETIREVVEQVLGGSAFMFAEPAAGGQKPALESDGYYATMGFDGPASGTIGIAVPCELCVEMAVNILGLDVGADVEPSMASDALSELLNIMCGRFLTNLAGDEPVFDLTIPAVLEIDGNKWGEIMAGEGAATFVVDDVAPAVVCAMVQERN